MTFAAIISLLLSIAKAVPPLAGLCERLITLCEQFDKARNEKTALERLEKKNSDVDAAIDGVGLHSPKAEQQPKANQPS